MRESTSIQMKRGPSMKDWMRASSSAAWGDLGEIWGRYGGDVVEEQRGLGEGHGAGVG